MALLQLPGELLFQIFDDVGPSYFREDLRRLTVCKVWSSYTHITFFKDIRLNEDNLHYLFSSREKEQTLCLIKKNIRVLELELIGAPMIDFEDIPSLVEIATGRIFPGDDSAYLRSSLLVLNLAHLTKVARDARNLQKLHIRTVKKTGRIPPDFSSCNSLPLHTVRAFLSMQSLTVLELDLTPSLEVLEGVSQTDHICPNIAALLSTLCSLRIRMRCICAHVLKPPRHVNRLRLTEVIVNLSGVDGSALSSFGWLVSDRKAVHAQHCQHYGFTYMDLEAEMEREAVSLVEQMATPTICRILTCDSARGKSKSFDVLTGKRTELPDDLAWQDVGTFVGHSADSLSLS